MNAYGLLLYHHPHKNFFNEKVPRFDYWRMVFVCKRGISF